MESERELYGPIIDLFKEDYTIASEVPLGPKRIDIVAIKDGKIIAVEVKLNKWKDALRQAKNYKLGADESYVAIPLKYSNPVNKRFFQKTGIGLITVDNLGKAVISIPALQSTIKSHNYSTLIRAHVAEQTREISSNGSNGNHLSFSIYLWYLANERQYFDSMPECYDGFLVSAHILGHYTSAFTALCTKLSKPFFIIPDTHAFQLAPISHFLDSKGGIKTSWDKLAKNYGHLINFILTEERNLRPEDFLSNQNTWEQTVYDLVLKVLSFQKDRVGLALSGLERFLDEPHEKESKFLVSPYFFFSSTNDPWYKITLKMATESIKHKGESELFSVLCASKSILLSDEAISQIIKDYSLSGLDGILLWIQDFDEEFVPSQLLFGLVKLIIGLKEIGKKVINLHGKFFSLLLCNCGLDGVGMGICYKEKADPTHFPTGGPAGGPLPKYYFPKLKIKRGKIEANLALQLLPSLRCDCDICNQELDNMMDAATSDKISKDLMKRHFLLNRRKEIDTICRVPIETIFSDMRSVYDSYEQNVDVVPIEHLLRWISVFMMKQK